MNPNRCCALLQSGAAVLIAASLCSPTPSSRAAEPSGTSALQQGFVQPPDNTRIMVRWWWFGPAVTQRELEREMDVMKQGGIGGFEVQPTYPLALDGEVPGLKNLKFMSPEFLDDLKFVAAKAKELGLRMDLTLGSGWPYGGPEFSAEEGATAIRSENLTIPPGQQTASLPTLPEGQTLIAAFEKIGDGFQQVTVAGNAVQLPAAATEKTEVQLYISRGGIMAVKRPAYGAEGRVIDHYNPASVDKFIRDIAEPEVEACGPNPPYAVFCDSLEVSGENWTPNLLAEFKQRRGYDLEPLLPALFNDVGPKTLEIRRDWGETVTELFNDYFNRRLTQFAHDHGTRFRVQGYGTPSAGLYSYAYSDLPEGEGHEWKSFSPIRWSASAVHLLGGSVASSETFTWIHSPIFRATPLDIKGEADRDFLCGINQIICHGWPYTAEGVPYPGWSFYAAGVFDEKNPWWLVMPDVTKYLQRASFVLRQGTPANDVALYLPNDDAWTNLGRGFSLSTTLAGKVSGSIRAITDAGYNLDFFDDPFLTIRGRVEGNSLAFGASHYRVVVLPSVERIPLATLKVLEQFARGGGILIATGRLPNRAPGYLDTDKDTASVQDIVQHLFKGPDAPAIFLSDQSQLGAALAKGLAPDVAIAPEAPDIGFVHRHTDGGEIYFVANTGNQPSRVQASFRITGLHPEIWDPMTGLVRPVGVVASSAGSTTLSLDLAPYASTIVAFVSRTLPAPRGVPAITSIPPPLDLSTGWTVRFGPGGTPVAMDQLKSWSELPDEKNFSGVATYERTVSVDPSLIQDGLGLSFDFGSSTPLASVGRSQGYQAALTGPVREAAVLYLNGERIGSVWSPPYALDVTGRLKAGENTIRIEVANLAINYMAGIKLPNYDYAGVTQAYGNRFQPQNLDAIQVLPAGLLGPVRLIAAPSSAPR